tara:strand:+ start:145 stop:492 length:348 start_codon:yes stop_codon:yes gene_type:complete
MLQVMPLQSIALPPTSPAGVRAQLLLGIQKIFGVMTEHNSAAEARAASVLCTVEAIDVTNTLFHHPRGSAVTLDDPMQRILKDLYTAQSHLMVIDVAYEALGKLSLGVTDNAPLC